ncbi:MAG: hypothetical protein KXJ50_07470 [Vulcanococcus sp.]|nr:hypothetical protein [Vulcanococcus sp.]MBW0180888.1 hypothetical protein [Vulcanococcus sp.]
MIEPIGANSVVNSLPSSAIAAADLQPPCAAEPPQETSEAPPDPVLCGHCGRTASNGLVCIGMCVADSGY